MLTKNQIKYITQLKQKKYRDLNKIFIAEGFKVIKELLNSNFKLEQIYTTQQLKFDVSSAFITEISDVELKKISLLPLRMNVWHCLK